MTFRQEYVDKNPAAVSSFLRGWFDMIDYLQHSDLQRREILSAVAIAAGVSISEVEQEFKGIRLLNFADNAVAFTRGEDITSLYGSSRRFLTYLKANKQVLPSVDIESIIDPQFIRRGLRR